CQQFKDLLPTF
nr:immunoglobulin light chain junction region [Macaca mulatta]